MNIEHETVFQLILILQKTDFCNIDPTLNMHNGLSSKNIWQQVKMFNRKLFIFSRLPFTLFRGVENLLKLFSLSKIHRMASVLSLSFCIKVKRKLETTGNENSLLALAMRTPHMQIHR